MELLSVTLNKSNSCYNHWVVILLVSLVDKSLTMIVYKVYNLPALHPALQKIFHYSIEGEYLALSADGDYATIPIECDMLTCVYTAKHVSI